MIWNLGLSYVLLPVACQWGRVFSHYASEQRQQVTHLAHEWASLQLMASLQPTRLYKEPSSILQPFVLKKVAKGD